MAVGVTTSGSATAEGAHLTVEQVQKVLVQPLQAKSVYLSSGVVPFDTNGSPIRIPKQAAPDDADLAWTGENVAIPENDFAFDHVSLLPSTMKSVKVITRFSNELARQSVVSPRCGNSEPTGDRCRGKGRQGPHFQHRHRRDRANRNPQLFRHSNLGRGRAITVDALYDAEEKALSAEVPAESLVRWMHAKLYKVIKKLKATGTGTYLVQPDVTQRAANSLLGYPITVTSRMPRYATGTQNIDPAGTDAKALLWAPN